MNTRGSDSSSESSDSSRKAKNRKRLKEFGKQKSHRRKELRRETMKEGRGAG
jgi:hypothetical protein